MRLKMDLSGILLHLNIKGYKPSANEDWSDNWCRVDFSFSSGNWLNYHKENDEVLLSDEVEALAESLERLLSDILYDTTKICCIEPDFHFILYPKKDLREDPKYIYVREGYEIADIYMEWKIYFWDSGLTDNYLSVTLHRDEIQILLTYLKYVMGNLKKDSPEIIDLIVRDFMSD